MLRRILNIGSESERGTSSIPNSQVGNSSNVTDDPTEKSTEKKAGLKESGSGSPAETSADGKPGKNSSESQVALIADGKESKATTSGKSTAASEVKPSNGKTNNDRSSSTIEKIENSEPKKTGKFHWADLDGDGMISPTEVLHFIDLLFEGESERNVEDIQFLIDYYFDQE
jgi:hypothetical protein